MAGAVAVAVKAKQAEVTKRGRKLLRLLHPDFGINQQCKGSTQQRPRRGSPTAGTRRQPGMAWHRAWG